MSEGIRLFTEWKSIGQKSSTTRGYNRELRMFCLYLRNPDVEAISLEHVMDYINGMLALGWDMSSFVHKCSALRSFFKYLESRKYKTLDPELIPLPKPDYKIPRVADETSFKKLLAVIPADSKDPRHVRNLAFIWMLWDSGARLSELLDLDLHEIDTFRMKAVIKTKKSKGRRPFREIMWQEKTNEALHTWISHRERLKTKSAFKDPDALFISVCSAKYGIRFTKSGAGEMLRRNSDRANLPNLNAHSFRHHMGHDIVKRGGSSADVMNILGHSSLASSTIYTMMFGTELEDRYREIMKRR